jgi:predicted RNase H-like nuclease (RuvC/YqgF family)
MEGLTIDGAVAVITVLIALAGMVSGIFTLANSTRKEAFEQLKQIVNEQKQRIEKLEQQNEMLSLKVDEREDEIEDLKDWAERLVDQVQGAGLSPVPFRRRKAGKK